MLQQSLWVLKWGVGVLRKGFSRGTNAPAIPVGPKVGVGLLWRGLSRGTNDPAIPMGPKVGGGGVKEGA